MNNMENMENTVKYNIPQEIIHNILHYLNPNRLHVLADNSKQARCVVNRMERARYIEKWLDPLLGKYICHPFYGTYPGNFRSAYVYLVEDMGRNDINDTVVYILNNYWYYKIVFNANTYRILFDVINRIKDKRLYIQIFTSVASYGEAFEDISMLANFHTLDILGRNSIGNLKGLGTIHTLNISMNYEIVDINELCNIHTLRLYCCNGLKDIGALSNVYNLSISLCDNIIDIGVLKNVHSLNLRSCNNIANISLYELKYIHSLESAFCGKNIDINKFANVHTLDMNYFDCTQENVNALGSVVNLELYKYEKIKYVGMLGSVYKLNVSQTCIGDDDMYALSGVHNLSVIRCNNITNRGAAVLANVHTLNITCCRNIKNINIFTHVEKLDASGAGYDN